MSLTVAPLKEAKARMDAKVAVGTSLRSWQIEDEKSGIPLAMRERAFWSARLQSAHMTQGLMDMVRKGTSLEGMTVERADGPQTLTMSKSLFVREGRKMLAASGYSLDDPKWEGTMLDHRSKKRLELIYDTNKRQASEYARFQSGQDEGALDAYPAQELIRESSRVKERPWKQIWTDHGGQILGGRMIALKSDPIWSKISRFGTPYPPFDFGSGMGTEDVEREEAEALGLIKPGETPERADVGFNDSLQASVAGLDPAVVGSLNKSFDAAGGVAEIKDGVARWNKGKHSVAIAMDVPASLPNAPMIKSAVADIARVHDYSDTAAGVGIPLTPVTDKMHIPTAGAEYWRVAPGTGMPAINVSPTKGDALSVAHEIGHEVDHRLFGQGTNYGTHFNPELKDLMKAIEGSPEIKTIKAMKWQGSSKAVKECRQHKKYLLEDHEQFARAYSQWIGERAGRTEYVQAIEERAANFWRSQWKKESFAPIAEEFEKLFKAKGWLRE